MKLSLLIGTVLLASSCLIAKESSQLADVGFSVQVRPRGYYYYDGGYPCPPGYYGSGWGYYRRGLAFYYGPGYRCYRSYPYYYGPGYGYYRHGYHGHGYYRGHHR